MARRSFPELCTLLAMAEFLLVLLFSVFLCPSSASSISFSFPDFGPSSPLHRLLFLGDARFSPSSSVCISGSSPSSSGRLLFSCPIPSLASLSFSSSFSFSMNAHHGDGLAFVLLPLTNFETAPGPSLGLPSSSSLLHHTLAVEFDSMMNEDVQDLNGNHVGVDVGSLVSVTAANLSAMDVMLNSGERFFSWVDYRAAARVLEVRLSKSETQRPDDPLLSLPIDLSSLWDHEMYVGFTSSTGASAQKHTLHSWTFHSWDATQHSIPADPTGLGHSPKVSEFMRNVLGCLLGMAMGSALAVSMVALWALVRRILRRSSGEIAMHPIILGYQQIITDDK